MKDFFVFCILFQNFLLFLHRKVCRRQKSLLSEYCRLVQIVCLIREKVVTFRMVKLNMLLSIFLITK